MQYQVGQPGRVIVARFNDGDDVLGGLEDIARQENLKAACFSMVGGIKKGGYVVGPETESMPPIPVWRELTESHEATGFGTIFRHGDQPKVHFHGTFAKHDNVRGGCLRRDSEAFLVLEVVIAEILGVKASHELDQESGMVLLRLEQ